MKPVIISHVIHVLITPESAYVILLSGPEEATGETRCGHSKLISVCGGSFWRSPFFLLETCDQQLNIYTFQMISSWLQKIKSIEQQ